MAKTQNDSESSPFDRQFWVATISSWLGTTMEYVDFALYGLATGLVFDRVFFPGQSDALALLAGFATYAVGFLARPLGALFFGRLGDRRGRKFVLVATIALMGGATTLIGAIPSHAQIGILAPILLIILRLAQGFGAGAELSGAAIVLAEFAPPRRRGLVASVVGLGSNSGTLLASLIWLGVLQLPEDALYSWGWRLPFLGSMLIAAAALVIRRHMQETPVFQDVKDQVDDAKDPHDIPLASGEPRGWWAQNRAFFLMLGLRIGENGPSYLAQGFLVGYVAKVLSMDESVPTTAVLVASILGFAVIPLAGWLTDVFGRRPVYRTLCAILVIVAIPAFYLMDTREPLIVGGVIVVLMCFASLAIFGAQAAFGAELFGARNRFLKMSFAKELGSILSGGTGPMVASALLAWYGSWVPLAAYWMLMAGIGFVTTFFVPETRGRDLTLVQDAPFDEKVPQQLRARS